MARRIGLAAAYLRLVSRMQRILLTLASLLLFVASATAGEQPLRVTVQQLLVTPEKFAGKLIAVTGYYKTSPEESSLFTSEREAYQHWDPANGIWLDPTVWDPRFHPRRPAGVARSDTVDGRVVRVVGTFRYERHPIRDKTVPYASRFRGYGSFRMWGRAIENITYFQRAR